jgi:hypothetical protein
MKLSRKVDVSRIATLPFVIMSLFYVAADVVAQDIAASLMKPAAPEKAPGAEGFLQRWLILDPISHNGLGDSAVRAAVAREFFRGSARR